MHFSLLSFSQSPYPNAIYMVTLHRGRVKDLHPPCCSLSSPPGLLSGSFWWPRASKNRDRERLLSRPGLGGPWHPTCRVLVRADVLSPDWRTKPPLCLVAFQAFCPTKLCCSEGSIGNLVLQHWKEAPGVWWKCFTQFFQLAVGENICSRVDWRS